MVYDLLVDFIILKKNYWKCILSFVSLGYRILFSLGSSIMCFIVVLIEVLFKYKFIDIIFIGFFFFC